MSGPSRNDLSNPASLRDVIVNPEFRVSLLIFFAPLAFLALEFLVSGRKPFFAASVFLLGSFVELALDAFLLLRGRKGQLGNRRLAWFQYLNRTVLGLPITIYLASTAVSPTIALFRLLPVLYLLCRSRVSSQPLIHLGLYAIGLFIYAAGLRYAWPGEREILQAAVGVGLGSLVLWREWLASGSALVRARTRRTLSRTARDFNTTFARETRLLEAILITPDRVRRHQSDRTIAPIGGEMLCVAAGFPGLHNVVDAFARRAEDDRIQSTTLFQEFEHEWDLCVDQYRQGLTRAGCQVLVGDRFIYGVELLEVGSGSGVGDRDRKAGSGIDIQRRVLELVFAVRSLLAFSSRSRRSLEGRGRSGWLAHAAIAKGFGAFVRRGPENPAIVVRGPVFRILENQLDSRVQEGSAQTAVDSSGAPISGDRLRTETIWIQPQLAQPVRKTFQGQDGGENWFSPEHLLAEYSIRGEGLEPLPDFFERLRYGSSTGKSD